jgi:hypothetical protein
MDSESGSFNVSRFHGYDYEWPNPDLAEEGVKYVEEVIDPTTVHKQSVPYLRVHKTFPLEFDENTVVLAWQKFLFDVMFCSGGLLQWDNPAEGTVAHSKVFHAQMAAYRILNRPSAFGEPGPEGVHQDVAELTCITLLKRENLAKESGGNRVWALAQPNGKMADVSEEAGAQHLLVDTILADRFDTLVVLDREVKHEALPIRAVDPTTDAIRDVLTFEIRRPWTRD